MKLVKSTKGLERKEPEPIQLIQMKQNELYDWKKLVHEQQGYCCPILGIEVPLDQMVVDHKHKTKAEKLGENDAGLIRGCIQFQANVLEGKISNGFKRYGLHKLGVSLPTFLRNLANYLDAGCTNLIHPSEKVKVQKVQKSCYKQLVKAMQKEGQKLTMEFPKSGKLTKPLEALMKRYNIPVKYYGSK